ncbi:30S ribosomal protein S17 [Syntrophobacter fumaroxidans]|uniref:Small ribosomal subunit protein uS17 n=1 Tax=Syntrophobacter fumaroxidans (strain DSM 10017 / MPOB) TaxID=335543 RepID=RS17_SYNFM|nr:30S ribosomal protein S17 [Syntrophobacter fumaroxidans]A0LIJ9.1 RecName: Full=Small ribosomal subunit protein uS17; AltName: Full=30S ribosomal protein S17 [Syntrophobacter fumaroxidans MPOB]ABK17251.1 SSU ribosomal protein S17P [Syntrophobacter fumaroxidans MPOB]HOI93615.1 30S ribosomal protein S17 [Syntrophobacter fumaroxidans]
MEEQKSGRKTRVGRVLSNKMDKTVVVVVERLIHHPQYHKFIRRQNKFKAHDAQNACRVGDRVIIEESRPISKDKRWVVVQVLDKAVI